MGGVARRHCYRYGGTIWGWVHSHTATHQKQKRPQGTFLFLARATGFLLPHSALQNSSEAGRARFAVVGFKSFTSTTIISFFLVLFLFLILVRNVVWKVKTAIQEQKEHISIPNLTAEGTNADMDVKAFDAGKAVLV